MQWNNNPLRSSSLRLSSLEPTCVPQLTSQLLENPALGVLPTTLHSVWEVVTVSLAAVVDVSAASAVVFRAPAFADVSAVVAAAAAVAVAAAAADVAAAAAAAAAAAGFPAVAALSASGDDDQHVGHDDHDTATVARCTASGQT